MLLYSTCQIAVSWQLMTIFHVTQVLLLFDGLKRNQPSVKHHSKISNLQLVDNPIVECELEYDAKYDEVKKNVSSAYDHMLPVCLGDNLTQSIHAHMQELHF